MDEWKRKEALRKIVKHASIESIPFKNMKVLETLVFTILSQNTNDINSSRAFKILQSKIGIESKSLSEASIRDIKDCIRPAGLYNVKAPQIHHLAEYVQQNFSGSLEALLSKTDDEIRRLLMPIKGVGPKTVDIILSFPASRGVLPVDTHIRRIARRLYFARDNAGYDEIKASLEEVIEPKLRQKTHLALIWFGRNICISRRPKCYICPITKLCPSRIEYGAMVKT